MVRLLLLVLTLSKHLKLFQKYGVVAFEDHSEIDCQVMLITRHLLQKVLHRPIERLHITHKLRMPFNPHEFLFYVTLKELAEVVQLRDVSVSYFSYVHGFVDVINNLLALLIVLILHLLQSIHIFSHVVNDFRPFGEIKLRIIEAIFVMKATRLRSPHPIVYCSCSSVRGGASAKS
jgi:hypothetical protein